MDTANNAPRSRYLARSPDERLQWVTRLPRLPPWIQAHLKTVEGRTLLTLDQAWDMWTLLQPDAERLQSTRVLSGGGRPGTCGGFASDTNPRPATLVSDPRPVHLLSAPALPGVQGQPTWTGVQGPPSWTGVQGHVVISRATHFPTGLGVVPVAQPTIRRGVWIGAPSLVVGQSPERRSCQVTGPQVSRSGQLWHAVDIRTTQ